MAVALIGQHFLASDEGNVKPYRFATPTESYWRRVLLQVGWHLGLRQLVTLTTAFRLRTAGGIGSELAIVEPLGSA